MKTCVIAIDCWDNMTQDQIRTISRLRADLRLSQHHDREAHALMPAWPTYTRQALVEWIRDHRPCRLLYVGQHWGDCLHHRNTGILAMTRLRPWVQIQVRPSLCRVLEGDRDRGLRAEDLGPGWHRVNRDLYQLT